MKWCEFYKCWCNEVEETIESECYTKLFGGGCDNCKFCRKIGGKKKC